MELYNDSDAPALDIGVLNRLKRLDPNLRVTFSRWEINPHTSRPILYQNQIPVLNPGYHLWCRDGEGRWHLVADYKHFGHREVRSLEADAARFLTPSQILDRMRKKQAMIKERQMKNHAETRQDILKANQSRIGDMVFNGKSGRRQAKIVSYAGQGNRRTPGDIRMDDKEDGWEKPERPSDD